MKRLTVVLMLTGMLFSCKKESAPADEQVKRPVTIRVPDFTISRENLRSANGRINADSSLAGITDLYYLSYNGGVKVHEMHQDSTDPNFGTFVDSLVPGNYRIVVIASQQPLVMHTTGGILSQYFDPGVASPNSWIPYKDVFHNSVDIAVPASGNPGVTDVTLNRIIGKVEVKILDALPANHPNGFIDVYFVNPPAEVSISEGRPSTIPSQPMTSTLARRNQFRFEGFMFGIDDSFEVRIDYKDKNTGAPLQKVIPNIIIWQNQRTIIQGYLYGAPNAGFQIKLNQGWSSDSTVVHF